MTHIKSEIHLFSLIFILYHLSLFPLQIRAGKYENVEKVNKLLTINLGLFISYEYGKAKMFCYLKYLLEISNKNSLFFFTFKRVFQC